MAWTREAKVRQTQMQKQTENIKSAQTGVTFTATSPRGQWVKIWDDWQVPSLLSQSHSSTWAMEWPAIQSVMPYWHGQIFSNTHKFVWSPHSSWAIVSSKADLDSILPLVCLRNYIIEYRTDLYQNSIVCAISISGNWFITVCTNGGSLEHPTLVRRLHGLLVCEWCVWPWQDSFIW